MTQSGINVQEAMDRYNNLCEEASNLNFITRDTNLQKGMIKKLENLILIIKWFKNEFTNLSEIPDEKVNVWFHLQCVANAYIQSLNMWINLKKNKNHQAWQNLVDAQAYINYAIKVKDDSCTNIELFKTKLTQIENLIFPPLQFISPSLIIHGGECSICGNSPEICTHIEKKVYRGRVCFRVNIESIEANHIALVKYPEDKACIFYQFEHADGSIRDCMTWKIIRSKSIINEQREGKILILRGQSLDIF